MNKAACMWTFLVGAAVAGPRMSNARAMRPSKGKSQNTLLSNHTPGSAIKIPISRPINEIVKSREKEIQDLLHSHEVEVIPFPMDVIPYTDVLGGVVDPDKIWRDTHGLFLQKGGITWDLTKAGDLKRFVRTYPQEGSRLREILQEKLADVGNRRLAKIDKGEKRIVERNPNETAASFLGRVVQAAEDVTPRVKEGLAFLDNAIELGVWSGNDLVTAEIGEDCLHFDPATGDLDVTRKINVSDPNPLGRGPQSWKSRTVQYHYNLKDPPDILTFAGQLPWWAYELPTLMQRAVAEKARDPFEEKRAKLEAYLQKQGIEIALPEWPTEVGTGWLETVEALHLIEKNVIASAIEPARISLLLFQTPHAKRILKDAGGFRLDSEKKIMKEGWLSVKHKDWIEVIRDTEEAAYILAKDLVPISAKMVTDWLYEHDHAGTAYHN